VTGWTDHGCNYIGERSNDENITVTTRNKHKFDFYSGYCRFALDSSYVTFQLEKNTRMHKLNFVVAQYKIKADTLGFTRVEFLLGDTNIECPEKGILFYNDKEWKFYLEVKHVIFFFGGDNL
jgi:hypothetical protein